MLDRTKTYPMPPSASIEVISGQSVAKTRWWDPRTRARLAAKWTLGLTNVTPTVKSAASVFGVSVPLVREEIAFLEARLAKTNGGKVNGDSNEMSSDKLDAWVRDHLLAVWDSVERVTRM